jgi:hypothetical protein
VRRSFLELSRVPEDVIDTLTSGRYKDPVDTTDYVRYLRGRLVGPGDDLADPEYEYPFMEWTSKPVLSSAGEDRLTLSESETFTVRTANQIQFKAESFEFWGPRQDLIPGSTESSDVNTDEPE